MKEPKTIIDELIKNEIKFAVQQKVNADTITSVAARAARDIRVGKELDSILTSRTGSYLQFKPLVWCYIALVFIIGFLFAIPLMTIDSETISQVPDVLSELELAASSNQIEQTSIVLLIAVTLLILVFCFIFIPMWNNLKRLGKI